MLGDTVNLSARLMQHAVKEGGGILCDTATQYAARHRIQFEELPKITVKGARSRAIEHFSNSCECAGKAKPVAVFQPYQKSLSSPRRNSVVKGTAGAPADSKAQSRLNFQNSRFVLPLAC